MELSSIFSRGCHGEYGIPKGCAHHPTIDDIIWNVLCHEMQILIPAYGWRDEEMALGADTPAQHVKCASSD